MLKKLSCTITLILMALCLYGQESTVQTDSLIPDLVITHSRYPVSLKSTFKPVIVINKAEIENQAVDDISQLLDRQLGLTVNSAYSNPAKDKSVFLQGASGEFTLVLIDGVPVTDPSGIGGSFDLRSLTLSQIERIEVIKGGQSALYGSDAVAGVINLITTGGQQNKSSGYVRGSYGALSTHDVALGGHIKAGDQLDIHLSGSLAGSDGISEALDEDNVGFDEDGFNRKALNAQVNWTVSRTFSVRPFMRYSVYEGDFDGGAFTDGADIYDTDWLNTGFSASLVSARSSFKGSYTYNKTNRTFDGAFGVFDFKGRFSNVDLFYTHQLTDAWRLSSGLNVQDHGMVDPNATIEDPDARIISPYFSLLRQFSRTSAIEGSLRYNNHSDFGGNVNYSLGGSTWLGDQVKLSAHWTTSFKAPNLFQLFGQFGANPDLQPQKGRSINVGVSLNELGVFSRINVNLFDRRVDDLIVFDFNTGYQNFSQQHDQGIEVGAAINLGLFDVGMDYVYLFGELDNRSGAGPVENRLRRPRHQLDTHLAFAYYKNNTIQLDIRYSGERDDVFFDSNTFLNEEVVLDPYWLGNIRVNYTLSGPNITLYGVIRNIWDTDFEEVAGFSTIGRNVHVGASLKF